MKRKIWVILLAALLLLSLAPASLADPLPEGSVEINSANFKDVYFRQYLINNFSPSVSGSTYYFTSDAVKAIKEISCSSLSITSLSGIEKFTELTSLDCHQNNIESLDLSSNTKLKTLDCSGNGMLALNVGTCVNLETINCSSNKLLSLDTSRMTKLHTLNASANEITLIDLTPNTALKTLQIGSNKLSTLNVAALSDLETLDCGSNSLTVLNVSACTNLKKLNCSDNPLTALDLVSNTKLEELDCSGTSLESLNLEKNTKLKTLDASITSLTSLDLSANTKLVSADCSNSPIATLSLGYNGDVTMLNCKNTALNAIDLSKLTKLEILNVAGTQLTALNTEKNTALKDLNCSGSKMAALDLSKNTALNVLDCSKTELSELDLSKNTALNVLDCSKNHLVMLDLSANTALTSTKQDGQTYPRSLLGTVSGTTYKFDLTKVLPLAEIAKVTLVDGSLTLDYTTGMITLPVAVTEIKYRYATGFGSEILEVTIPTTFDSAANAIMLNASNPPTGSSAEVDGVTYPIVQGRILLPEGMEGKVITQYTYNDAAALDHGKYPIGMKVWFVKNINDVPTAVYMPDLDNILQYMGSSIRITGIKGIRMITGIPSSKRESLIKGNLSGLKLLEYGTIVAWKTALGGKDLNHTTKLAGNYAYRYDKTTKKTLMDAVFEKSGGLVKYTNVLTFDDMAKCIPDLTMRPYMTVMDEAEEEYVIYGGSVVRSIGFIAYQNRNAFKAGTDAYKYIWEIIHAVYGTAYDAEYQP